MAQDVTITSDQVLDIALAVIAQFEDKYIRMWVQKPTMVSDVLNQTNTRFSSDISLRSANKALGHMGLTFMEIVREKAALLDGETSLPPIGSRVTDSVLKISWDYFQGNTLMLTVPGRKRIMVYGLDCDGYTKDHPILLAYDTGGKTIKTLVALAQIRNAPVYYQIDDGKILVAKST